MRKIRDIQSESKRRQDERSRPIKPVQLPDKYSHIPAKVTARLHVRYVRTYNTQCFNKCVAVV